SSRPSVCAPGTMLLYSLADRERRYEQFPVLRVDQPARSRATARGSPARRSTATCSASAAMPISPGAAASAPSSTTIDRPSRSRLMSAVSVKPPVKPGGHNPPSAPPAAVEFRYTQTERFPALLAQLGASLVITTYQANKLLVARAAGAGLSTLVRTFDRPMGLAADGGRLALGSRTQVWVFRNAADIAPRVEPAGAPDP